MNLLQELERKKDLRNHWLKINSLNIWILKGAILQSSNLQNMPRLEKISTSTSSSVLLHKTIFFRNETIAAAVRGNSSNESNAIILSQRNKVCSASSMPTNAYSIHLNAIEIGFMSISFIK